MTRRRTGRLTVRLDARTLKRPKAQAKARRCSVSCFVRELVETTLSPRMAGVSAYDLSRAWVGAINDARLAPGAKGREGLPR